MPFKSHPFLKKILLAYICNWNLKSFVSINSSIWNTYLKGSILNKKVIVADVHNPAEPDSELISNTITDDQDLLNDLKVIEITKLKPILGIAIAGGSDTEMAMPIVADIQVV